MPLPVNGSRAPGPEEEGEQLGPEAVVVPVVFGLIFLVGVVGNVLVLAVLGRVSTGRRPGGARSRTTFSPTTALLLNLSAADLGFLLGCVPVQASVYSLTQWPFGSFLCRFSHFFSSVALLVSVFTLVALSLDRYVAVVRSGRGPRARSRGAALLGLGAMWSLAAGLSVPVALHRELSGHPAAPNSTFCWERWSGESRSWYRLGLLLLGFVLPLIVISGCYSQTTQTVLLVIAAFTLCWTPHHVIVMWVEFGRFPLTDATFAFRIASHCLSYGNSCVNPVLYAFLSENFRRSCARAFSCRLPSRAPAPSQALRLRMENFSTSHSTTNI